MLGHARITITLDIYTHLFEDACHACDIRARMAAQPIRRSARGHDSLRIDTALLAASATGDPRLDEPFLLIAELEGFFARGP